MAVSVDRKKKLTPAEELLQQLSEQLGVDLMPAKSRGQVYEDAGDQARENIRRRSQGLPEDQEYAARRDSDIAKAKAARPNAVTIKSKPSVAELQQQEQALRADREAIEQRSEAMLAAMNSGRPFAGQSAMGVRRFNDPLEEEIAKAIDAQAARKRMEMDRPRHQPQLGIPSDMAMDAQYASMGYKPFTAGGQVRLGKYPAGPAPASQSEQDRLQQAAWDARGGMMNEYPSLADQQGAAMLGRARDLPESRVTIQRSPARMEIIKQHVAAVQARDAARAAGVPESQLPAIPTITSEYDSLTAPGPSYREQARMHPRAEGADSPGLGAYLERQTARDVDMAARKERVRIRAQDKRDRREGKVRLGEGGDLTPQEIGQVYAMYGPEIGKQIIAYRTSQQKMASDERIQGGVNSTNLQINKNDLGFATEKLDRDAGIMPGQRKPAKPTPPGAPIGPAQEVRAIIDSVNPNGVTAEQHASSSHVNGVIDDISLAAIESNPQEVLAELRQSYSEDAIFEALIRRQARDNKPKILIESDPRLKAAYDALVKQDKEQGPQLWVDESMVPGF